jgi:CRP-like cAMP-binding protein
MTEVLLKQLNSQDLQWLKSNGQKQYIDSGASLIQQTEAVECLYIILNGEFVGVIAKQPQGVLGRTFSVLEDDSNLEREIMRLGAGEVIGEITFLNLSPATTTFTALENSLVLEISSHKLREKLQQDIGFAARFYRAIAILLTQRFEHLVALYLRNRLGKLKPLQDIPLLFGEFKDSDLDWMVYCGLLQKVPPGQTLAQAGRQAENLYIILQGKMSLIVNEAKHNQINKVFMALELEEDSQAELEREIAQLTQGEIVGATATFDSYLSTVTLRTQDTILLAIPKEQLLLKLQQDPAMAARFYRAIAILLSARLQGMINRLGFGKGNYQFGQSLSSSQEYEDEIDPAVMDNIFLGGARFDWMLKRLKII